MIDTLIHTLRDDGFDIDHSDSYATKLVKHLSDDTSFFIVTITRLASGCDVYIELFSDYNNYDIILQCNVPCRTLNEQRMEVVLTEIGDMEKTLKKWLDSSR